MSKELQTLARPKSQRIACILVPGDVITNPNRNDVAMRLDKIHKDGRVSITLVGDFKIIRNLKGKK